MKPRVLLVDNSESNLNVLRGLLDSQYELATAKGGEHCLNLLRRFSPDLVLAEIALPGLDGYETCRLIKAGPMGKFTQVILISTQASITDRLQAYDVGADDFIARPFDHDELLAKIRIQFRLREAMEDLWSANDQIQQFNHELEALVQTRTSEVVATRDIAIFTLAKLAESRDPETGEHLDRMRNYCRILAEELHCSGPYREQVDAAFVDNIYRSSPLHDIGKVGVPDAILLKPGRLTKHEFDIMKEHTTIGATALEEAVRQHESACFLSMAIDIARHHHERFDGRGYPFGLAGYDIPLAARVAALADVYDALTSVRVYKPAYDPEVARRMIEEEDGRHFDPVIVRAFLDRHDDFLTLVRTNPAARVEPILAT